MSYYDWEKPKVGQVVYRSFSPAKVGRIERVGRAPRGPIWGTSQTLYRPITVRHRNGTTFEEKAANLKCFRTLVEEHERKAEKFRKVLNSLDNGN